MVDHGRCQGHPSDKQRARRSLRTRLPDCKKVYVGETMRTAEQRAKEHQMYARTGNVSMSAVAAHTHQEGHTMHWKPRVVVKESNTVKRKIREALVIAQVERQGGSMNQDRGTSLSKIWTVRFDCRSQGMNLARIETHALPDFKPFL